MGLSLINQPAIGVPPCMESPILVSLPSGGQEVDKTTRPRKKHRNKPVRGAAKLAYAEHNWLVVGPPL